MQRSYATSSNTNSRALRGALFIFALTAFGVGLVGCGDLKINPPASGPTCTPKSAQKVIFETRSGKDNRSLEEILDLLIEKDVALYNQIKPSSAESASVEKFNAKLEDVLSGIPESPAPGSLIDWYEQGLADDPVKEIVYNRAARTMNHFVLRRKMQCSSGTDLFLTVAAKVKPHPVLENIVVIMEPGHVLPGEIHYDHNCRAKLTGYETTSVGLSIKSYGYTDELHLRNKPMRVVKAEHYLGIKATFEDLKDSNGAEKAALEAAAAQYDIQLEKLETLVKKESREAAATEAAPFSFGKTNVPEGDHQREEIQILDLRPTQEVVSEGSATSNSGYGQSPIGNSAGPEATLMEDVAKTFFQSGNGASPGLILSGSGQARSLNIWEQGKARKLDVYSYAGEEQVAERLIGFGRIQVAGGAGVFIPTHRIDSNGVVSILYPDAQSGAWRTKGKIQVNRFSGRTAIVGIWMSGNSTSAEVVTKEFQDDAGTLSTGFSASYRIWSNGYNDQLSISFGENKAIYCQGYFGQYSIQCR